MYENLRIFGSIIELFVTAVISIRALAHHFFPPPSKRETLTRRWFNVGPTSYDADPLLNQHNGSMFRHNLPPGAADSCVCRCDEDVISKMIHTNKNGAPPRMFKRVVIGGLGGVARRHPNKNTLTLSPTVGLMLDQRRRRKSSKKVGQLLWKYLISVRYLVSLFSLF